MPNTIHEDSRPTIDETAKPTPGPWEVITVPTQIGHAHKIAPIGACLYVDHRNATEKDAKTRCW